VQVPQFIGSPQSLFTVPQFLPKLEQVCVGLQPHTLGMPLPPHESGKAQLPQLSVPPQPFGMVPQSLPCAAQVVGVQPQTLAVPPPPQLCGERQLPQLSVLPQPFEMVPQFLP
jgi:hypothetical protein